MKLLILAVDALDRELLDRFMPDLPNFRQLIASGGRMLEMRTTFPPDSDTAWATALSGLNPAEHGIVRFVDPLRKSFEILHRGSENSVLAGNTIFDDAAAANRKVLAVFPHLGYPVWPAETSVVVRASAKSAVAARPPALLADYPDPALLNGVRGFPGRGQKQLMRYLKRVTLQAEADAEFGLRLLRKDNWDLAFVYWSTIDAIGHFFWDHYLKNETSPARRTTLEDAVPTAYKMFDRFLGEYVAAIGSETDVIVMSDHGHGGRPRKLLNINELLRRSDLLTTRNPASNPHVHAIERMKRSATRIVGRYGLARSAGQILRLIPGAIDMFTRPAIINWPRTIAYASDMSGIKPYEYGGVLINQEALGERTYESVRDEIIRLLTECSITGTNPVRSAYRREDLYSGQYIARYPDILVEMNRGYGLGWATHRGLTDVALGAAVVPGSHRGDTATFLVRAGREVRQSKIDISNFRASVADLLELPGQRTGGGSIFQASA